MTPEQRVEELVNVLLHVHDELGPDHPLSPTIRLAVTSTKRDKGE